MATARDKSLLHTLGVKEILNAAKECENAFPLEFKYLNARIADTKTQDLYFYFDECCDFIKASERVLVHCVAGISRSSTFVLAFLMKERGLRFVEALEYVKSKRAKCAPNESFIEQLKYLESKLFS